MPQRIEFEGRVHEFPDDFTDADIAAALGENNNDSHGGPSGPIGVVAARAARPAVVRAGEELATSPLVGRAVKALSTPAARLAAKAVGVGSGSVPGYIMAEALTSPATARVAETGLRAGGAALARAAGSRLAQAVTGPIGIVASMVTEPGDRPAGETPESTAQRQRDFAAEYDAMVKADKAKTTPGWVMPRIRKLTGQ